MRRQTSKVRVSGVIDQFQAREISNRHAKMSTAPKNRNNCIRDDVKLYVVMENESTAGVKLSEGGRSKEGSGTPKKYTHSPEVVSEMSVN